MLHRLGGLLRLGVVCLSTSYGQSPIVRIENDWELPFEQPDYHLDTPQVNVMMQRFGVEHRIPFHGRVNYGTDSAFSSGRMQVQLYHHDTLETRKRFVAGW